MCNRVGEMSTRVFWRRWGRDLLQVALLLGLSRIYQVGAIGEGNSLLLFFCIL
jgi:hypothetical protein